MVVQLLIHSSNTVGHVEMRGLEHLGDWIAVLRQGHSLLNGVPDHCVTHKIQQLLRSLEFPLLTAPWRVESHSAWSTIKRGYCRKILAAWHYQEHRGSQQILRPEASSISICLSEVHPEDEEVASVEVEVEPEREAVCQTSVQAAQCDLTADSMCEQVAAVFSSHMDHQQLC